MNRLSLSHISCKTARATRREIAKACIEHDRICLDPVIVAQYLSANTHTREEKKVNKFVKFVIAAAAALSAFTSGSAFAQQDIKANAPHSAYVQDARGVIARDPFGLCWRTGYWTPADAVAGCDKPLAPVCTASQELKDGKCVEKQTVCGPNQELVGGVCKDKAVVGKLPVTCGPTQVLKNGVCVDLPKSEKVSFAADALFDFNKSVLKPEGKAKLDDLASKMGSINLEVIIAVGHTDSVGSDAYNQKLSIRRAESVKAYLVNKGIEANRVYTEGKGEKVPVADNKTDAGRAKNRRVEIEVVGTRK